MILHPGEERVSLYPAKRQAPVAQWIEHLITVQKVGGSSPSGRAAAPLGAIHRWGFCISTKHSFGSAFSCPFRDCHGPSKSVSCLIRNALSPQRVCMTDGATELARHVSSRALRDIVRPTLPLQWYFREKIRPARQKTLILGCFERAGRVISRSGTMEAIAMKPVAPLRGGVVG